MLDLFSKVEVSAYLEKIKIKMEDEINLRINQKELLKNFHEPLGEKNRKTYQTKIYCRSGNIIDLDDLNIVHPENAESIIILSDEEGKSDINTIKCILALRKKAKKIITEIKRIIMEKNLKPKMIYTNFSKNRTEESFNGRGMFKRTTRNIEHDIPHQVYFTQYILGNTNSTQLILQEEKDMIKGEKFLRKHGYSKIISKKDDVLVIHESDFASNTKIREVIVVCDDDTAIKGEFLFYDSDLNKLKNGNSKLQD